MGKEKIIMIMAIYYLKENTKTEKDMAKEKIISIMVIYYLKENI